MAALFRGGDKSYYIMACIKETGLSRVEMMKNFGGSAIGEDRALEALRRIFVVNNELRLRPNGHSQKQANRKPAPGTARILK